MNVFNIKSVRPFIKSIHMPHLAHLNGHYKALDLCPMVAMASGANARVGSCYYFDGKRPQCHV